MKLKNKNQIKAKKSRAIKAMALTQIFCLMLEVFAISFIFTMSLGIVSGITVAELDAALPGQKLSGAFGSYYKKQSDGTWIGYVDATTPLAGKYNSQQVANITSASSSPTTLQPLETQVVQPGATPVPVSDSGLSAEVYDELTGKMVTESGNAEVTWDVPPAGDTIGTLGTSKLDFLGTSYTFGPMGYHLAQGAIWGGYVLGITMLIAQFVPEDQKKTVQSFGTAAAAGLFAGKAAFGAIETGINHNTFGWLAEKGPTGNAVGVNNWGYGSAIVIGLLVAYYVYASQYEKEDTHEENIEFKCMLWQAPRGGADCNECNNNPLMPCSEYRCKSLGQTCVLINAGTGFERCIDSSPNDVTSPGIEPMEGILKEGYAYEDVVPRPPGESAPGKMSVTYEGGCIPGFTPFDFGIITTDYISGSGEATTQPAQCKIDFEHTNDFDDMAYWMGDSNLYLENHTQTISIPGTSNLNSSFPQVQNDGEYTLYIRCMDGNGNKNVDEFAVRFCIDKTPDVTAPIIKAASVPSSSPVLYQVDNMTINVYTNEPSNCKWSRKDSDYANMENQMTCNNALWEMNAEYLYTCTTTLTSIKDKEENKFYFRCEDTSVNKNQMHTSYPYTLYGTQSLDILSVGPAGTIGSATSTAVINLTINTDNGYNNGFSNCYYSTSNQESSYIQMFQTGTNVHSQSLDLVGGSYNYFFKCVDAGGNTAYNSTNFTVFVDTYVPNVIKIFSSAGKLYFITDEDSTCKYSTTSCNFDINEEGTSLPDDSSTEHLGEWNPAQTYYIKCYDKYNNQPDSSECSIIVRPFELEK